MVSTFWAEHFYRKRMSLLIMNEEILASAKQEKEVWKTLGLSGTLLQKEAMPSRPQQKPSNLRGSM
jgi:hypothetical protein